MSPKRTMTVCMMTSAVMAASTAASAAIDYGPTPDGFGVYQSFAGTDGVGQNASRWFADEEAGTMQTNWANQNITFNVGDLPADNYMIGITARNGGTLPLAANYDAFRVQVSINGGVIESNARIVASDTDWNTIWIDAGQLAGQTNLTLRWKNDSYRRGVHDANIQYGAVTVGAASIPAPSAAGLAMAGVGFCMRRRR